MNLASKSPVMSFYHLSPVLHETTQLLFDRFRGRAYIECMLDQFPWNF
jgi:hypothetical protein